MLRVFPLRSPTCRATEMNVAGWKKLEQKVESHSNFRLLRVLPPHLKLVLQHFHNQRQVLRDKLDKNVARFSAPLERFSLESKIILVYFGFASFRSGIGQQNSATFSTNEKQTKRNRDLLASIFPRLALVTCSCLDV